MIAQPVARDVGMRDDRDTNIQQTKGMRAELSRYADFMRIESIEAWPVS
jgi:hypothetical protein